MKNKLLCALFLLLLAAAVYIQFSPADQKSIESENRKITAMPKISSKTLASGRFMKDFESHINDTVGYRSYFIDAADKINNTGGIEPPDGKVLYTDKDIGTEVIKKSCLLVLEDKIMEVFSSSAKAEKTYTDAINTCAENLPKDVAVYSMLIPTQLAFGQPMYKNIQTDQKKTIDNIYSGLDKRIKTVDVYSALEKHQDEYIFFRTDHHWTQLGAYYGCWALTAATGVKPAPMSEFEKRTQKEKFWGYLSEKAPDEISSESRDVLEWYNIDEKYKLRYTFRSYNEDNTYSSYRGAMYNRSANDYGFFFKSDHPYVKIRNSSISNGRCIMLIKDSYANALAPWLVTGFENVIMIDPRSFDGDIKEIIKTEKVTDLVFMHYVFTTGFGDYCKMMTDMWQHAR